MILFVSAYPGGCTEAEVKMQRVALVDLIFAGYSRAYLTISLKRHLVPEWEEVSPGVMVHRVNLFVHFWYILYLATRASMVYVHSLENALRVLPLYLSVPIVTDISGPLPDGAPPGPLRQFAEKLVLKYSKALVVGAGAAHVAGVRLLQAPSEAASREARALVAFVAKGEE